MATKSQSLAFVTPSFARDVELCRALVRSAADHVPSHVPHYIIVPRRDRALFASLAKGRTRLLAVEEVLSGMWRVPGTKGRWISSATGVPLSGWLVQQLVKLAAPDVIDADALVLVDSDIAFIRDVDAATFAPMGTTRLYRVRGGIAADDIDHWRWYENACRLLGVAPQERPVDDYIGHVITWDAAIVRSMRRRIETVTKLDWRSAIARARQVSEYMLYGLFADRVHASDPPIWHDERERCLSIWDSGVDSSREHVRASASRLSDDDVAISITAHAALSPAARSALLTSIVASAVSRNA